MPSRFAGATITASYGVGGWSGALSWLADEGAIVRTMERRRNGRNVIAAVALVVVAVVVLAGSAIIYLRAAPDVSAAQLDAMNSQAAVEVASAQSSLSASQSSAAHGLVTAFIGDSYAAGDGSTVGASKGWADVVSKQRGWKEVNVAVGGTGYTGSYVDQIPRAAAADPATVIVFGGRNDLINFTAAPDKGAESVRAFYAGLREALPSARIVAVSPVWDYRAPPAGLPNIGAAVESSVASVRGEYIDIGEPLTGHRDWIGSDGVHPNDAGYAVLAAAVQKALGT